MFGMNNQIYAFTSRKSTADKTYSLFSDRIDKESLKPDNFAETIAEVDFQSGILVNRSGSFEYCKSGDESKLLVFMEQPYKRNENNDGHENMATQSHSRRRTEVTPFAFWKPQLQHTLVARRECQC